jgi:ribonuclease VapC
MIIVDSSAILAVIFGEADADIFASALKQSRLSRISAPTFLEASMAATRVLGPQGCAEVKAIVGLARIEIIAFDSKAAQLSIDAFLKYGKGQGHPAQLNYGDCMSYALAKMEGMPLLFKGDDFRLTDVECAV